MSRVTHLKEIIDNDDVSIYTILYELYQDKYYKRGWASADGSHPFTGDVTSIFEPLAGENKSLENYDIVIAAGGESTYEGSYDVLDAKSDTDASTDIYTAIVASFPSGVGWTCPSKDIIVDRYNLFKRELAIEVLKEQRDALLEETEKYVEPDYPHKFKSKKDSWKTYRQSIRNLTEQIENSTIPTWSSGTRDWGDDIPFDVDIKTFDPTKGTLRLKSKQESRHATAANKLANDADFWTSNDTFGGWKRTVKGVEENITSGFNLTKPDETNDSGEDGKNIFIVTVDDKTTNHPIQGNSSNAFFIDDVEGDFLKLTPGTYQFDQSHYSNKGYKIKLFIGGGGALTEYTENVSYNGNAGDAGAYLEVVITELTPFSLQYHHESHTSSNNDKDMGGYIHVGGTTSAPPLSIFNGDTSGGSIDLYEKSSSGTNKIKITAPSTLTQDYTLTLPTSSGTKDHVLKTDGNGTLSWSSNDDTNTEYTGGTGLTLTSTEFSVDALQTQITKVGTLDGLTIAATQTVSVGGNKITNVATPTSTTDAATKSYVDGEISGLIDTAPATLNTLNELAAALGDDANFSTTITTTLAGKQPTITSSSDISMKTLSVSGDITGSSALKVDTISEKTSAAGVTIDGVLLKDNSIQLTGNITCSGDLDIEDEIIMASGKKIKWVENTGPYLSATDTTLTIEGRTVINSFASHTMVFDVPTANFTGNLNAAIGMDVTGNLTCSGYLDIAGGIKMGNNDKIEWIDGNNYISGTFSTVTIEGSTSVSVIGSTKTSFLTPLIEHYDDVSGGPELKIKGTNTTDAWSKISLVSQNSTSPGDGWQIKNIDQKLHFITDRSVKGTFNDVILELVGNSNPGSSSTNVQGYLTVTNDTTLSENLLLSEDKIIQWKNNETYITGNDTSITIDGDTNLNLFADTEIKLDSDKLLLTNGHNGILNFEIKNTYTTGTGGSSALTLISDDGTSAGDSWQIKCSKNGMYFYSDIETKGTITTNIMKLTNHATQSSRKINIYGKLEVSDGLSVDFGSDDTADIFYRNSSGDFTRLAKGTAGQVLKMNSGETAPEWGDSSSGAGAVMNTGDETVAGVKTFSSTVIGDISGNAGTATALAASVNINGVAFNGTGEITVTAAGSTLSDEVPIAKGGTGSTTAPMIGIVTAADQGAARTILGVNDEGIQDIVGAMFSSNTETGISATYQDDDGTIDLVVGTLNQDTTGKAATATALAASVNINGVAFNGTGDITVTAAGSTLSNTVPITKGGTGSTTAPMIGVVTAADQGAARTALGLGTIATRTAPTGTVVGTTDTQTLSSKTLSGATLTGSLTAGGGTGSSGQVLKSTVSGVQWANESGGGGGGGLPSGVTYTSAIFTVTGNIRATQDITAYYGSDRRFKDNLVRISEPNEKIKKINGYEFDWNENHALYKNTHDVGVVAQEIEEVLPEIVIERDDGYKAVKYEKIIALLIESNKDLLKRVEELESVIKKK
jgi:hypothetical protein